MFKFFTMNDREQKKEKYKQLQKEIAEGKNIIPGVFNYCDRWCERCRFIHNCTVAIVNSEMGLEDNPDMESAIEDISIIYETSFEMLEEMAAKLNINLKELPDTEPEEYLPSKLEKDTEKFSLSIFNWFKENEKFFSEKAEKMRISGSKELDVFNESLEIINYFAIFISVKVNRACIQDSDLEIIDDDGTPFPKDSDGSAKVAVLSIDRTIEAFTALYKLTPEHEDAILGYLSQLAGIRKRILKKFPEAMNFKRPGFDD
jgi:hypothetical protein